MIVSLGGRPRNTALSSNHTLSNSFDKQEVSTNRIVDLDHINSYDAPLNGIF